MTKTSPLLDERSIATLMQQDSALYKEGKGRGRLVLRMAFSDFLPPMLRANLTKGPYLEGNLEQWRLEVAQCRKRNCERLWINRRAGIPESGGPESWMLCAKSSMRQPKTMKATFRMSWP